MSLPPWHAEIVELHNFFFGWLGGTLPATDAIYARLVDTMALEFAMVSPRAVRPSRASDCWPSCGRLTAAGRGG
jgi:hypothetical protein